MSESMAGFTSDQLQVIGTIVVTFGSAIVGIIWHVALWKAKVDYDLDNLGHLLKTEKGLARFEMKMKKEKPLQGEKKCQSK